MFMYCDDPIIITCGTEMTFKALKVWTWMARSGNTMMNIPEKRCFGLSATWIGVKFFVALGVAAVTAQKVMRACAQMTEACSSTLSRDQYRSLIGFWSTLGESSFCVVTKCMVCMVLSARIYSLHKW